MVLFSTFLIRVTEYLNFVDKSMIGEIRFIICEMYTLIGQIVFNKLQFSLSNFIIIRV